MAEIIGEWIIDPNLETIIDRIETSVIENLSEMFGLALDETVNTWASGGGYNDSGEEISWNNFTKKGQPVLLDTGNLMESLELVLLEEGWDFKFDITSTAEVYGRKGEMYKVTPQNVSIWNSWIPHKNVPAEYRVDSEAWLMAIQNAVSDSMEGLLQDGSIKLNT